MGGASGSAGDPGGGLPLSSGPKMSLRPAPQMPRIGQETAQIHDLTHESMHDYAQPVQVPFLAFLCLHTRQCYRCAYLRVLCAYPCSSFFHPDSWIRLRSHSVSCSAIVSFLALRRAFSLMGPRSTVYRVRRSSFYGCATVRVSTHTQKKLLLIYVVNLSIIRDAGSTCHRTQCAARTTPNLNPAREYAVLYIYELDIPNAKRETRTKTF
jgi:hypothetical protein